MGLSPRDPAIDPVDALAIYDLIADYSFHYDGEALADFAALFTEEGRLETPAGGGVGHAEIEAWAVARWAELSAQGRAPRHFQTNTRLEHVGADQLRGKTQLLLVWIDVATGTPEVKFVASYLDDYRRTEEGWRFERRRIAMP
ncbi:MAG: nuclear transport factor 2 family protein [Myxococcota bacterium]|jgi:hypothetical protein|nr:nuclear transport factor 2 family protein [Myxococcota bacterium]